jgi:DNA-binding Xre family transcriptional regulator
MANRLPVYVAFDKMLTTLDIKSRDVCVLTGVSDSRLSLFRSGKKANMGTCTLDALLDAAQSINPRAREVFATYIGGKGKLIEEMTMAEKGELLVDLSKSMQSSINTDSKSLKTK